MFRQKGLISQSGSLLLILAAVLGAFLCVIVKQLKFLPVFYLVLVQVSIAALVYSRNRKAEINFSFAALVVLFSVWNSFAYFATLRTAAGSTGTVKLVYFSFSLLLAFLAYFTSVFPQKRKTLGLLSRVLLFSFPALAAILIPLNLVVREQLLAGRTTTLLFGSAYPLYVSLAALYGVWVLVNLFISYQTAARMEKLRVRYVLMGLFLSFSFLAITNLLLPGLGEMRFTPLGPFFSSIFITFAAYAILKHRLMSIEVVIQRAMVYFLAALLIAMIYGGFFVAAEYFLGGIVGYPLFFITAAATLFIAAIYQPLVKVFQNVTEQFFFRSRYDYRKTLIEVSKKIASVIKLEELTGLIVSSFVDTMKVAEISFLLPDKEKGIFAALPLALPRYTRIEISAVSPIIFCLLFYKDILVLDEIEDEISRLKPQGREEEDRVRLLEQVRSEMEKLDISLWVPIISKDELIGVIALGDKLSGDIFTTEDFILLNALTNQTAVALDNARLYSEVLSIKNYNEEILQNMMNGVLTADGQGKVTTFNSMAERISGRKAADVIGRSCEEIWGKRGAITIAFEKTVSELPLSNFEAGLASPEKGLVPVSFSSNRLRDGQGKTTGVLLSIQDLSDIKELEDKARRTDKLAALATMAAGMAHEIKNPLSSMKVFTQLLPRKFDDPEYRQKLEEVLKREIDRIDRIVESLLGFTRATVPVFEKAEVDKILEEVLANYSEQAQAAGVKIVKNYAPLPEVELDRSQISQVFSNLILNAIQAMPDGGELKITTQLGKVVDYVIQSVMIKFSDSGHGISEEAQKKLFDPFFTTKYGGTGLGLTITHSIIDGHKGAIDLESQPGKGTIFTVTLPVNQRLV